MSVGKPVSPFVTATFQNVLNLQIAKIMNAIDAGDSRFAYKCLRTLILSLNPKHTKDLMENDIAHINRQIIKGKREARSIDTYRTKYRRYQVEDAVTGEHILELFHKVMTILHEKGYLEREGIGPKHRTKTRFEMPK